MAEQSYHFDMGNSTKGPVGLCARITADSPEAAVSRLYALLLRFTGPSGCVVLHRSSDEYIHVYLNMDFPAASHIDDVEPVE